LKGAFVTLKSDGSAVENVITSVWH